MKWEDEEQNEVSHSQEKLILETFSYIHRIIYRRLGSGHMHALEDVKQRVFLKLWRWKQNQNGHQQDLSGEEWQKMAHVVANNEVIEYFRKKDNHHVQFSQIIDDNSQEELLIAIKCPRVIVGNSLPEIRSLLALVWVAAQTLTLKQKYSYFLQFHDILIEFLYVRCCSIEELAQYFEVTEKELSRIIEALPLSDEEIAARVQSKLLEKFTPRNVWVTRSRTKAKLAARLKEFIFDE